MAKKRKEVKKAKKKGFGLLLEIFFLLFQVFVQQKKGDIVTCFFRTWGCSSSIKHSQDECTFANATGLKSSKKRLVDELQTDQTGL